MTLSNHHHHHHHHHLLLLLLLLPLLARGLQAESAGPSGHFCREDIKASFANLSSYADHLLVELASNAPRNGFLATDYGSSKEYSVYGLAQCRGDVVGKQKCSTCIRSAAKLIRTFCPRENDARIWFDYCFLRYSYMYDFFGEVDTDTGIYLSSVDNVTNTKQFNKELVKLMEKIKSEALNIPQNAGLGKGQKKLTPSITLYALVQCTRDLSPLSCAQCLAIAESNFPTYCGNKKGCRIFYSSCFVRYELRPFFFPISTAQNFSNDTHKVVIPP